MGSHHQQDSQYESPSSGGPGFDTTTPFRVLEREHERLRFGLARLRALLGGESPLTGVEELRAQLRGVRASLGIHFAFEENHGSLHHLVVTRPDLRNEISSLRAEHLDILLTLDRVDRKLSQHMPRSEAAATLASVLERLTEHDLRQHRLVHRALLEPSLAEPTPRSRGPLPSSNPIRLLWGGTGRS